MNKRQEKLRGEYYLANIVGIFGVLFYGAMRLIETLLLGDEFPSGIFVFSVSLCTCVVMLFFQAAFKNRRLVPVLSGLIPMISFIIGAVITKDFEYYYISMLCVFGIVCLYQRFTTMLVFFLISLVASVVLFTTVFGSTSYVSFNTITIDALLFIYGAFFLMILTYRATSRESRADMGLTAFSALLTSTPNMMAIIDGKKRIRYISVPFAKFAGMSVENATGRPFLDLFSEDSIRYMFADILDADEFFEDTREIDVGGEKRYFKIISDQLAGSDKAESMFIEIMDITQTMVMSLHAQEARLEAENARLEAERAMIEAERANKSKSQFLATMSHEIRTPMNAIIGISQIELNSGELTDKQTSALNKIFTSGHSLLGIINDILDLSKIETGKLEMTIAEYDLPSLINDAAQLNIVRIGSKPIEFCLDADEFLPSRMIGDELHIKQVLNNVLSNAFKYTDKGMVHMSVMFEATEDGQYLVFKVSDTGQGMTPDQVSKLFDEYSRFNAEANSGTEGTGLGMNITRRLVLMMEGDIHVESEAGKGSVFTIRLKQGVVECPVIGKKLADNLRDFKFNGSKQNANLQFIRENMSYGKVLVVDDVATNLYVAEGLLMPYSLHIEVAVSGFEAIDKIKAGNIYDVVFMDHMMPKMDGIEATNHIRALGYTGKIIALTANAIAGNAEMALANGFDDFLSKPIDARQLNAILNKYVRKRTENEELNPPAQEAQANPPMDEHLPVNPTLLAIFKQDADSAVTTIRETLESGDVKLFTTTAHAMKSACANVGETEISELAAELEAAGIRGDAAFISENADRFLKALSAFTNDKKPKPGNVTVDEDTAFLCEKLTEFISYAKVFDSDEAVKVLTALEQKSWAAATAQLIAEIKDAVMFSEFDRAVKLCESVLDD